MIDKNKEVNRLCRRLHLSCVCLSNIAYDMQDDWDDELNKHLDQLYATIIALEKLRHKEI